MTAAARGREKDPPSITVDQRVRYVDCDPMGVAHHSVYPVWFEIARTELLRHRGIAYRDLEAAGTFIVVARLSLAYYRPARYDQTVQVTARLLRISAAKIEHDYTVEHDGDVLCSGQTTLACVDRDGKVQPVPAVLKDY